MQGGMPMQQQPMQSSAGAKTMIAQPSPFANGGPMQGGMQPQMQGGMQPQMQGGMQPQMQGMQPQMQGGMPNGAPPNGGFSSASPMQKTIVAGLAPPIMGGQLMPPNQQQPTGFPQMPPNGPAASGPNKTVMLQPSEGVVSVAATGHAVQPAGASGALGGPQGATTLFWIVSLVIGVAVGALAYVIVLQL